MDHDRIKNAKKKLADINKIVAALDPSIRSAAFDILVPLYFADDSFSGDSGKKKTIPKTPKGQLPSVSGLDQAGFFNSHDHDQPKDNVHLVAAWLYSQHGVFPIGKQDICEYADSAGLTIPDRPDNTMRYAKKDGKNLYRKQTGGWQLTVKGEAYLKETYSVKKGNKPRPTGDD